MQTTATPPQGSQFNCQTLYISYGASNIVGLVNDASGSPSLTNPVGRFVATVGAPNAAPADGFSYWVGSLAIGVDPASGQPAAFGTTWGHGGQSNRPIYKLVNGAATITDSIYNGLKRTTPDLDPWGGLSFNSVDGKLYGVVNNSQQQNADYVVFRMDLKTGVVEKQVITLPGATNALQSLVPDMFFDQAGAGYLGAKTNADPGNNSWTMYRVDFTKAAWVGEPFINFTGLNSFDFYGAAYLNGNIYLGASAGAIYQVPFQRNLQGINLTAASPRIANYTTGIETPPNMSPSVDGFAVSDLGSCALAPVPPVQPKFACQAVVGYLVQGTVASAYEVNLATGASSLAKSGLINDVANQEINAIGYNIKDNYIWGQRPNTNQIVRIGSDWSVELITIPGLPANANLYIGDVSSNGVLFLYSGTASTIYRIDVDPASPTYLQLLPNLTTTSSNIFDWAFSPIDGNLYTISAGSGTGDGTYSLLRFNPSTGARTVVGVISGGGIQVDNPNAQFGAVYMDDEGSLFMSANTSGKIYRLRNPHTGNLTAEFVANGPSSTQNDGARCPLSPIAGVPPTAVNDTTVTDMNVPVSIGVLTNDIVGDNPINTGSVAIITQPQHGTVTVGAGGVLQYTPTNGYVGTDSLKYTVADNTGAISNIATALITITAVPMPPVAVNDSTTTPLNTPITIPILSNDSTKTNPIDIASVVITQQPTHGTAVVNPDGTITYTPTNNYAGLDTLLYTVKDTSGLVSNPATVIITIPGVAPTPVDDPATTSVNTPVTIPVLNNDGGPLDSTTVTIVTPPTHGTPVVNPDGTVTYTPNPGYTGPDTLTYTVKSPDGTTSVPATVIITVTPVSVPPVAVNDSTTTTLNTPITIPVLSNDSTKTYPIDTAGVVITQQPTHGTATVNPNGSVTYTPANNYAGLDTLIYTVKDTSGLVSNPATVIITIPGVAPTPVDDAATTPVNTPVTIPVLNNDGGSLDSTTVAIVTPPTHGTPVVNPDGTISYTPNPGYTGPDTLTYTVKSPDGTTSVPATVIITVTPVLVPPLAVNDSTTTDVNTPVLIDVLANDSTRTAPIAVDSVEITAQPQHGTATVDPTGKITYTPASSFTGTDSLKYTVKDTSGLVSNVATVYITINPPQPPFACTAVLGYLVQDTVASAYEVNLATGVSTLVKSGLINDVVNRSVNAIGYNVKDNYIWGQRGNTNQLVRIGSDWSTRFFPIAGLPSNPSMYIGDVSSDGVLFMYSGTANIIYRVDVNPASPAYLQLLPNLTTTTSNIFDWAFSPVDGNLYSISAGGGTGDAAFQLLRFNPSTGARTIVGVVTGGGIQVDNPNPQFGAVYMDDEGSLFVNANTSGKIYRIRNPHTGGLVAEFMANGPASTGNDGARCPLSSIAGTPPKAINDTATTVVNVPVVIDILANDSTFTSPLNNDSVTIITQPQHGTVSVDTSGKVTYTPAAGYIGTDSLKYTVKDTSGLVSNVATVYITIDPPPQPVFSCTAALGYLFQNNPTDAFVVNLATGTSTLGKSALLGTTNAAMNAVGYNVKDNYLWASRIGTNEIVRVGSDWSVRTYPITGIPANSSANIGDVSNSGVMYWYTTSTTTIYRIDLDPASATYLQLLPSLTTTATNISDWAFSPIDGNLYALNNNNNDPTNAFNLYRFNPVTGARTNLGKVAGGGIQAAANLAFGAAYMDNDGNLYVSNNETGNIYRIASPHTGGIVASLVAKGPLSGNNDGARCSSTPVVINPPVAVNDSAITDVNIPVQIDILVNDTAVAPINKDSTAITLQPQHGTVVVDTSGKITYTPAPGYTGTDSLKYILKDTTGQLSNEATVYITITPAPPVFACTKALGYLFQGDPTDAYIIDLATGVSTLGKSALLGTTNARLNALGYNLKDNYLWASHNLTNEIVRIGSDWSVRKYPIAGAPANGNFNVGDVNSSGVMYWYLTGATEIYRIDLDPASANYLKLLPTLTTPASNITDWSFSPVDNNLYAISNNDGGADAFRLYRFDPAAGTRTNLGIVSGGGIQNAANVTFGAAYMDSDGSLYVSNNETGNIYRIASPHTGGIVASLVAQGPLSGNNDGARCPTTAVVNPPVAVNDIATTVVNVPVLIDILANDSAFTSPLNNDSVAIITPPQHGTVTVDTSGKVTYTPAPGYTGTDSLTYTVKDAAGLTSNIATVVITVTAAPVPPVAVNDSTTTPLNTPVTIPVLSNDSAKTNPIDTAGVVITQQPKHGTATVNPNGTITYTPVNNYAGLDTLLYTVKDTSGLISNPATVVIKTPGVAPTPVDDAGTTPVNTPVTIPVLNNDGGPLDSTTVTIVTPPTHGTPVVNPDGTITYTPNPGYSGPDTLTYTVKSPDGTTSVPVKVIITVTPAPVPPVAVNDSTTTPLNTPVTIPVLGNDSAKTYPIAPATVVITQQPKHGTVTVNPDGTVTYTPTSNYAGLDTLLYTVKDTSGLVSNPATVIITIPGVAPTPVDDAGTTPANTPVTIPVLNNDGGPLDSTTVTIVTPPTHGTPVVNPDGTITYTPNPGYTGPDTLTYTVKSPDGTTSVPVKVIITVTPAPVPPVAVNDSTSTPLNTPVTIPVLSNDSAKTYPIAPATVVITQQPKHGTVTVNPDGTVTYTPTNNYAGLDTLLYTVKDTSGLISNPATVVIKTPGVAPTPVDDAGTTPVNTPVTIPVLNNDGGPLDSTTVTIVTPPTHGTPVVNPDGTITYTPNPGYSGPDTLTYTVKSPDGTTSVPVKVIITVTPAPVPPVAVNDSTSTPLNTPVTIPVLGNDSAKTYPIAPATVVITQQPKHGTVTVNPDGTVTYTPVNNYAGLDTLLYTVKDTSGLISNPATVVIKTPGVAPTPVDDAGTTPVNTPVTIPVLNNDGGPLDSTTVTIVTPPTHGTVVVNPDGTVTYTPNPGYSGPDTLTYTVKSPDGTTSVPATVIITVTPGTVVPPVAVNDSTSTPLNTPVTIPVLGNDSAKTYPIAPATVVITQQPKHGTVTVNPDGTVTYTPTSNYAGLDTLLYTVKDTSGLVSNPATVIITIPGVAPTPVDDAGTTPANTPVTIPVLNNDGGPLDSSTVTIVTPPTHGTVVINPDGTVTYTPNPGYKGPDTLTYTVKSPDGTTSIPAKVVITVTPASVQSIPPVAVNDSTTTPLNTPVTIPVLGNDSTKTNPIDPATVVITQQPKHGTVTVNPDGTVRYTPTSNYAGPDTLLYTVKDTSGLVSNPATVIITIPGVAPTPVDDAGTTQANTPVTIPVLNNDGGPLDSSTVTIVTPPTHGTVVVNPDGTVTYTPNPGYSGPDSLTYIVKSPDGTTSVPAKVVITVTPAPIPPVAVNDSTTTPVNTPVTIPVLGNDSTKTNPIDPATVVITQQPKHGTVTVNPNGTVIYTPTPGYVGPDDFKYTVKDNTGATSNPATVTIEVTRVIPPPVAQRDSSSTVTNKPVVIPVIDNDSDSIGIDRSSIIITEQPKHGTVTVNPDGTITYTPDLGYTGPDSLKYIIKNTSGISSNPATVVLTVESETLSIPNALSPNGDGKNDKFIIRGLERYQGVILDIYNRWGNQVYHSTNYSNTWDGNGLNEGTYYYILKVKDATGEKAYKGWILLVR